MAYVLPQHRNPKDYFMRDVRPWFARVSDFMGQTNVIALVALMVAFLLLPLNKFGLPSIDIGYADLAVFLVWRYHVWLCKKKFNLTFKLPKCAGIPDPNNPKPGKAGSGKSEGIFYVGNHNYKGDPDHGKELWLTNSDARTHVLYIGTTGSGKTEGLKSMVSNALAWGSGFVYVDGKADTDLWASLYSLARRFGRDDDLLILNYMTANSDKGAVSNSMNPFSNGSASYLANMVTSLMPDAGGDNAMWKERAVALMFALMPALTWKRDNEGLLLDVGMLRENIELKPIVRLSRDHNMPERILRGLKGYLDTLPGYVDDAFDDEGNERPPSPDQPMYDLQVARQQHGYLSMQFTRALQSLADEYGYIFKVQLADIDVLDVVLNRRILVALIPALEKSGDEAANLGKLIAASLKGMMGATLGNTVEGSWENAIGSKQTRSSSSFITVFDEVGYYTAQGMAVMAAQARSLGFSLIFAAQDLPSMEKRVKQEARSILANCNLKIFGKLEDPTDTKNFFKEHVGTKWVVESTGFSSPIDSLGSLFLNMPFLDNRGGGAAKSVARASYEDLRNQREGQAYMFFGGFIAPARLFYAVPEKVKALRVHRLLAVPSTTTSTAARERAVRELTDRLNSDQWTAAAAMPAAADVAEIAALANKMQDMLAQGKPMLAASALAVASLAEGFVAQEAVKSAAKSAGSKAQNAKGAGTAKDAGRKQPAAAAKESNVSQNFLRTSGKPAPLSERDINVAWVGTLPPQPGDEFAFIDMADVDGSASYLGGNGKAGYDADSRATVDAGAAGDVSGRFLRAAGVIPGDIDPGLSSVSRNGDDGDIILTDNALNDATQAMLKTLAGKLNEGLGNKSAQSAGEGG